MSLRFCFLTTFYPPHNFGGDGIAVQRLARGLARRGHHVTVVHDVDAYEVLARGPAPSAEPEPEGVEVVPLRSRIGALSPLLTQQTGRPPANGGRIRALLAAGGFDVVNFHNVSLVGGPGVLSWGGDAVKVYTAHEHWLVCPMHVLWRHDREACTGRECLRCALHYRRPPQLYRYTGYLERQLREVDVFVAMSEFSRRKHREFGFPHPMEVVPAFLPDEETRGPAPASPPPHPRPYFLFVGRLEKMKGLQDVIPLFRGEGGVDLVVAGSGGFEAELRALAEGSARVTFVGRVAPDALEGYYRNALALVVPTLGFETFGIVLIEAFRCGTPVIARNVGPLPEIVDAAGGGLVFDTTPELAAALRRMVDDPAARERTGAQGRRAFLERWTESAVVPRYLEVVRAAAARKGHRRVAGALDGALRTA